MPEHSNDLGGQFTKDSELIAVRSILFRKRSYTFPSASNSSDFNDSLIFGNEGTEEIDLDIKNDSPIAKTPNSAIETIKGRNFSPFESNSCITPVKVAGNDSAIVFGNQWHNAFTPLHNTSLLSLPSPISTLMSPMSLYSAPSLPVRYYSPIYGSPMFSNPYSGYGPSTYGQSDRVSDSAKQYRNAASFAEARHTWSGTLISSPSHKNPVYSCKVFLGGVPWEMTDHDIKLTFSRFGNPTILRPGQHVKLSRASQNKEKAGYLYLIFESDKQVKALINACTHDFSNGGKYYFALNQSRYRPKDVQIIPWNVNDTSYVKSPSARMDANKTVFVGALHGMLTSEGLAQILEDLFGGVVYVGIDTDKYKYPIGSARGTFSTTKAYNKAVQAAFIDIKCNKFQKKIQIDPFLEDSNCSHCRVEKGPIFCRSSCMAYLCRGCWDLLHSPENMQTHQPIMRNKSRY